jgi:hypothetical protein
MDAKKATIFVVVALVSYYVIFEPDVAAAVGGRLLDAPGALFGFFRNLFG